MGNRGRITTTTMSKAFNSESFKLGVSDYKMGKWTERPEQVLLYELGRAWTAMGGPFPAVGPKGRVRPVASKFWKANCRALSCRKEPMWEQPC